MAGAVEKVVSALAFRSSEEQARAEIGKLNAARETLALQRSTAEKELTELRQALPDRELDMLLDGTDATPHRDRIGLAEAAIAAADAALRALLPRLKKGHSALRQARAEGILRQAEKLAEKRLALVKKVETALRDVASLSECEWVPLATSNQAVFQAISSRGNTVIDPGAFSAARIPKYELMAAEENGLRNAAREIASLQVRENGQARGETVNALLADLAEQLKSDLLIAPSEAEVRGYFAPARIAAAESAWHASFESQIALSHGGSAPRPFVTRYELVWQHGRIDPATSRVTCEAAPEGIRTGPLSRRDAGPAYGF